MVVAVHGAQVTLDLPGTFGRAQSNDLMKLNSARHVCFGDANTPLEPIITGIGNVH